MGEMIGGLIPTFLISRLLLWVFKKWRETIGYLILAHAVSLVLCALLYGFGTGQGGFEPRLASMLGAGSVLGVVVYGPPQAIWLLFDIWRLRKRRRQLEDEAPASADL